MNLENYKYIEIDENGNIIKLVSKLTTVKDLKINPDDYF